MMSKHDRPRVPGLARRVLRRVVPEPERGVVEGELAEGLAARERERGRVAAHLWYAWQVWGFVWRILHVRRLIERGESGAMNRFGDLGGDARWAVRTLQARPVFTAVAVATLALGIGANAAIFALINAHFLAPLPWQRADELVLIWETRPNSMDVTTVSPGNYWTWREEATSFEEVAAFNVDFATLSGDGIAERVTASVVAPHWFDVLGVQPALGSGFDVAAVQAGDAQQAIVSHSLWVRRYGSDAALIGRDIRINGTPHTVVGVMPPSFRQPERSLSWQATEVWRPLLLEELRTDFDSHYLRTVARLRRGVTVEQARAEVAGIGARLATLHPETNRGRTGLVYTLDEYLLGDARPTLLLLLAAGGAVLLIVCANVANLTLARGQERRREFAVRAALGSGRGRLVRQVLVESLAIALLGAGAGTLFNLAGVGGLQAIQSRYFSGFVEVAVDWRVVVFTVGAALLAGGLFALPLARSASRPELRGALGEGGARAGTGARANRTRELLIVSQVGLAATLLVVAALLVRSFNQLVRVPPGFRADGIVTFTATADAGYRTRAEIARYHDGMLAQLRAIPGVAVVGSVSDLMFTTENMWTPFEVPGRGTDPANPLRAEYHIVRPGYFEALEIPLLRGGTIEDRAYEGEIPVLINARMATEFWPDGEAVGASFVLDWQGPVPLRVAGIVGDVLDDGFDAVAEPSFFVPFGAMPNRRMAYLVRTAGDPAPVMAAIRSVVAGIDPDIPAADFMPLEGMLAETVARPRAASLIGLTFALIALLVSASGIYGVMSYAVQSRTREIGIRTALGATAQQILSMVMGQSTRLVGTGLMIGIVGALVVSRALSGVLFGVPAWDPVSLLATVLVLGAVGSLAAWLPARRAVRIDPTRALRTE